MHTSSNAMVAIFYTSCPNNSFQRATQRLYSFEQLRCRAMKTLVSWWSMTSKLLRYTGDKNNNDKKCCRGLLHIAQDNGFVGPDCTSLTSSTEIIYHWSKKATRKFSPQKCEFEKIFHTVSIQKHTDYPVDETNVAKINTAQCIKRALHIRLGKK